MDTNSQNVLAEFSRELDQIEAKTPMVGSYQRIEPEIIEVEQAGHSFRIILYHYESKSWFGSGGTDWSLHYCREVSLLKPDDVVIDLGCNAGFLTTWFAKECPQGHVHAFDPYPWNTASAKANAALNGLSNVTTHTIGIGNQDRTLRVPVYSSKTFNAEKESASPSIDLVIKDASSLRALKPTFVKIDIEGAEQELAFSDFSNIGSIERGYVEMHPSFIEAGGGNPADFLTTMRTAGFDVKAHNPNGPPIPDGSTFEVAAAAYYFTRTASRPTSLGDR